jgi:hypothetical protein
MAFGSGDEAARIAFTAVRLEDKLTAYCMGEAAKVVPGARVCAFPVDDIEDKARAASLYAAEAEPLSTLPRFTVGETEIVEAPPREHAQTLQIQVLNHMEAGGFVVGLTVDRHIPVGEHPAAYFDSVVHQFKIACN